MADLNNLVQQNTGDDDIGDQSDDSGDESSAPPASATAPLPKKQKRNYLNELESLSQDPAYNRPDHPSTKSLESALKQARDLYQQDSNRQDWAEVAELVGRAAARLGAANSGLKSHQDMSNLDFGKGVDWEGRRANRRQEYRNDVSDAQRNYELERQNYADESAAAKEQYGRKQDFLKTGLKEQGDEDKNNKLLGKMSDQEKRAEISDLRDQEKDLSKKLTARQTLANQLLQEPDVSAKEGKKLQEKYGPIAAAGDVDLSELQGELTATDKPGRFYGTNPDPKARQQKLQEKTAEIKNMLDAIHSRKQQLIKSLGGQQQPDQQSPQVQSAPTSPSPSSDNNAVQPQAPAPTQKQDPKIVQYAQAHTNGDYDAAKKILVGRGYSPQE